MKFCESYFRKKKQLIRGCEFYVSIEFFAIHHIKQKENIEYHSNGKFSPNPFAKGWRTFFTLLFSHFRFQTHWTSAWKCKFIIAKHLIYLCLISSFILFSCLKLLLENVLIKLSIISRENWIFLLIFKINNDKFFLLKLHMKATATSSIKIS